MRIAGRTLRYPLHPHRQDRLDPAATPPLRPHSQRRESCISPQQPGPLLAAAGEGRPGTGLDDAALPDHGHAAGDPAPRRGVMGDEPTRGAGAGLQPGQQVEDLGLNADVQAGGRLVAGHQASRLGQSPDRGGRIFCGTPWFAGAPQRRSCLDAWNIGGGCA